MTDAKTVLSALEVHGVTLRLGPDGGLLWRGRDIADLPGELAAAYRKSKPAILKCLGGDAKKPARPVTEFIADLAGHGWDIALAGSLESPRVKVRPRPGRESDEIPESLRREFRAMRDDIRMYLELEAEWADAISGVEHLWSQAGGQTWIDDSEALDAVGLALRAADLEAGRQAIRQWVDLWTDALQDAQQTGGRS